MSDRPKDPWGAGDANDGDNGASSGSGAGSSGPGGGGPRNPWQVPPGGNGGGRKAPGPSALDEFLRRTRAQRFGGGGGTGGGAPNYRNLWIGGVGVVVLLWLLFTSIHPISAQQRGVVTRFGSYVGQLDPGIQLTLPAPIEQVQVIDVTYKTENFPENGTAENLTLTGDRNIVDLGYTVRWAVSDPRDFAFQLKNPRDTVRATAESAMRAVMATVTLNDAIGSGQNDIASRVQTEMQQILNGYHSGIRIEGVSMSRAAAPAKLAEAFNEVTAAQQSANTNRNGASTYAQQKLALAQGDAQEFNQWYEQYKLAPEVTKRRLYYETMEAVLAKNNKTIVETPNALPYIQLPGVQKLPDAADKPQQQPAAPASNGSAGQ